MSTSAMVRISHNTVTNKFSARASWGNGRWYLSTPCYSIKKVAKRAIEKKLKKLGLKPIYV